jgi:hypothetical protein
MRADTLRDYDAWRRLVAGAVRRGIEQGAFGDAYRPEMVAVLAIALVDGVGVPLALSDPEVTVPGAIRDVLAALRELLRPRLPFPPLARRLLIWQLGRPRRRGDLERLVHVDAVAEVGPVAVYLGGAQAPHELQDLRAE